MFGQLVFVPFCFAKTKGAIQSQGDAVPNSEDSDPLPFNRKRVTVEGLAGACLYLTVQDRI